MEKKKHYNNGVPIALTFPVSKEQLEQKELNDKMKKELAITEKQNKEQAELISELKDLVKSKKGKK